MVNRDARPLNLIVFIERCKSAIVVKRLFRPRRKSAKLTYVFRFGSAATS
jgi:hypothetical protein